METLRILIVDDHTLFRKGLESLLRSREDIEVVGTAGNGLQAIELARRTMPDAILMDVEMPECDGLEATRRIKRELPHIKIVILTVVEDAETVFEAIKSGAQGYLLKDLEVYQLYDMLDGLRKGNAPLSGEIAAKILGEFKKTDPGTGERAGKPTEELSERERSILQLLVDGKTNREIAGELVITENTVKTHLTNILEKLHLQNRIQAAVYAVRQGLVQDKQDEHS